MKRINWTLFRIVSSNGAYEVSIHGLVRNRKTKQLLKTWSAGDEYQRVTLYKNGSPKDYLVHRLVAEAFLNNYGLNEINHKDEVRTNNYFLNLEYCTHKYNCNYSAQRRRQRKEK